MSDTALSPYASNYLAKKALFSFLGNTFRLYGKDGSLQFFIKQKAFKLKEEITIYKDEAQTEKRLTIKARGIGDWSGVYDVFDATSGEQIGAAKREGLKSLFKDEWTLLDGEAPVGKVMETGGIKLLLRKFLPIIPQTYEVQLNGAPAGVIQQQLNPFQLAYDVDFNGELDPRMGVAITVLLLAIEGQRDG